MLKQFYRCLFLFVLVSAQLSCSLYVHQREEEQNVKNIKDWKKNIFCISGVCKRKTGRCKVLRCEKEGFLSVLFPLHTSSLLLAASSAQPAKRSSWKHHCTSGVFFWSQLWNVKLTHLPFFVVLISLLSCTTNQGQQISRLIVQSIYFYSWALLE